MLRPATMAGRGVFREGSVIDNLTHAIIGTAVAALAPAEASPAILWGVLAAAELPDGDILLRYTMGEIGYLKHHRGPTHGLITLPLQAALITAVMLLIWPSAGFLTVFGWTLLGGLSHVLSDFTNDYGTRGLWPFSNRWVAYDLIPIVDFYLWGLIAGGWTLHWLTLANRQAIFAGVWLLIGAYVALRWTLRRRAWQLVVSRFDLSEPCGETAPCGDGWQQERVTIHPTLLSLNAWRYVVQGKGEYLAGMVWVGSGRVSEPDRARNQFDQVVLASLKSTLVDTFAHWARRPRVHVERKADLYQVSWKEARYEVDGITPFSAWAWLDDDLELIDEGMGRLERDQIDRSKLRRRLLSEMGRHE